MKDASASADDWLRLNRAWWDERAPGYAASEFYDVPGFLAGKDSLRAFEPGEVGDVRGKRLLRLRRLRHGYLDHGPWVMRAGGNYAGLAETADGTWIKWNHHIGSIVNAVAAVGLRIEFLHEYDFTDAPWDGLERGEDGLWRIPAGQFRSP